MLQNKQNEDMNFKDIVESLCRQELQNFMTKRFWTGEGEKLQLKQYSY